MAFAVRDLDNRTRRIVTMSARIARDYYFAIANVGGTPHATKDRQPVSFEWKGN